MWFRKNVIVIKTKEWSKTTLNYWMMVGRYPNLQEDIGGSLPNYEISSLLDKNLVLANRPSISK